MDHKGGRWVPKPYTTLMLYGDVFKDAHKIWAEAYEKNGFRMLGVHMGM